MDATGFESKLLAADLVITGEGRIDESTAFGKTALGVARRAQVAGVPCVAVGGGVTEDGAAALRAVGAVAVPVIEAPMSVEAAIALGTAPIRAAGERIGRLVGFGIGCTGARARARATARATDDGASPGSSDAPYGQGQAQAKKRRQTPEQVARAWVKRCSGHGPASSTSSSRTSASATAGRSGGPVWTRSASSFSRS